MVETSFIPKKRVVKKVNKTGGPISLFLLIAIVVFVVSIAFSVGVFLYKGFLIKELEANSSVLEKEQESFKPALIEELTRLDSRIQSSREILDNHINLTKLFDFLEENTLKSIQFESFDYILKGVDTIDINMKGVARDYASVALQSDIFGDSRYILNPIFSKLNVDRGGNVTFDFRASVDIRLIRSRE
ncbi:hypothetical protein ACFLY7_02340 [Patescibacteria group bacterium]